ncbi:MAG TPA: macrolide family glycosyltransferase [Pseudonocardiaceae bacterium]
MGKHIAFITGPASGHINPTLPLVRELTKRGHRVSYVTAAEFAATIEAAGATPIVLDWGLKPIKASKGGQTTGELAAMLLSNIGSTRKVLPHVEQWLADDPPDLICYDSLTVLGSIVADRLGVPGVATVPNFAGNDKVNLISLVIPPDFDPSHPTMREYVAARKRLAEDFGVADETIAGAGAFNKLNLVFLPREFQIHGELFGDDFLFIGPSFGDREDDSDDWQPPTGGRPLLFVSLGTVVNDRADFFALCVKAFGGTEWHVAMAVGHQVDVAELGEIPGNIDVRPYFPQPTVLRHATVFLSHAGMGSTMESLMRQVPLVTYPQIPEQTANARRVAELGLGRLLDTTRDLDPDELRRTVQEVAADQAIRANLARMAEHLRAAGGPAAGADAVEELLPGV